MTLFGQTLSWERGDRDHAAPRPKHAAGRMSLALDTDVYAAQSSERVAISHSIRLNWPKNTTFSAVSDDSLIEEIGRRLAEAIPARSRVLLFGSRARGEGGERSDVDVLVIEPSVRDAVEESVRLRRLLGGLGVPIDVLVVSQAEADRRSIVRGTVVERAVREGRVLVDT